MRLPIHLQREIARLHFYDLNQSNSSIAHTIGVAPNTVRSFRSLLRNSQRNWSDLQMLDDNAWELTLGTQNQSVARHKESPDWSWVHREMRRPDATLEQLWREWREQCPEGIAYSQFTASYRKWAKKLNMVMRQTHIPGDKIFVDFAGRTVEIKNRDDHPPIYAQIFIAVLGYSNFTYLQAVASQKTADWLKCHIDCFSYLGGVPKWVVPDNLKAAVLRREKDRIVLNPAYVECLRHYGTAALPAGVRKPKHKSKAEVGVQIAQRWVLFALRNREFFSLDELNAELKCLSVELNTRSFKKMSGNRLERFESKEKSTLKPHPEMPFEICDWRYAVRVRDDYHVEHHRNFYSVPFELRGERVDLRFTATMLEIMHRSRRIALHPLAKREGEVCTIPEHRPITHIKVLEGEPKALLFWSQSLGKNTEQMIRHHLENRHDAVNGLRAARKMKEMALLYGNDRFEEACAYALSLNITALRSVESILKQSPDKKKVSQTDDSKSVVHSKHINIRGAKYYGESV